MGASDKNLPGLLDFSRTGESRVAKLESKTYISSSRLFALT